MLDGVIVVVVLAGRHLVDLSGIGASATSCGRWLCPTASDRPRTSRPRCSPRRRRRNTGPRRGSPPDAYGRCRSRRGPRRDTGADNAITARGIAGRVTAADAGIKRSDPPGMSQWALRMQDGGAVDRIDSGFACALT